jgi:hypothetical protein
MGWIGTVIGIFVGLAIGFSLGLISMAYWNAHMSAPERTEKDAGYTESYYLCKPDSGLRERSLIIKGDRSGATTIVFPWDTQEDAFRIEETTDLTYVAIQESPKAPDAYGSIELNRVSGDMVATSRISSEAVKLLVEICDKRVPLTECGSRMRSIPGGSWPYCGILGARDDIECPKWRNGSNIAGRFRYQCRSADRKF